MFLSLCSFLTGAPTSSTHMTCVPGKGTDSHNLDLTTSFIPSVSAPGFLSPLECSFKGPLSFQWPLQQLSASLKPPLMFPTEFRPPSPVSECHSGFQHVSCQLPPLSKYFEGRAFVTVTSSNSIGLSTHLSSSHLADIFVLCEDEGSGGK